MSEAAVRVDVRPDAVAVLTLDQPGSKANVLTSQMWTELEAAVDALAPRTDVRGLVLASAKPGIFIAGADLKLLANATGPNDPAVRSFIEHGLRVLDKLEALPFPTCAAIDGAALGGGLEVALACDYRVVGTSDKVKLGLPEVTLGLIPGWGGTQRLPRLIGIENTMEMTLSAVTYDARTAAARGLAVASSSETMGNEIGPLLARPAEWRQIREVKRGPVPSESFEPGAFLNPEKPPTQAQWNRMLLTPTFFNGHRDYVNTQMAESLCRDASLALIDVLEKGAPLPLAEAIPLETEAFLRLAGSPASKALIEGFFASRKK